MNPYPLGWGIPAAKALGILYGHKRGLFRTPKKWGIPTATFGDFFKAIDTCYVIRPKNFSMLRKTARPQPRSPCFRQPRQTERASCKTKAKMVGVEPGPP